MTGKFKATWVIGGTSGIGAAVVRDLKMIYAEYSNNRFVACTGNEVDVRSPEMIKEYIEELSNKDQFVIDKVVFCAGVNYLQKIGDADLDINKDIIDVNLIGFINVINVMREKGIENVRMVVIGSDAAWRPMRTSIAYCASKAGLHMAAKVAARELAEFGWRINVVAPGMTDRTEMTQYVDETVMAVRGWTYEEMIDYEKTQEVVPGRVQPYEVAILIQTILNGPDHLNGAVIPINGGRN